MTNFEKYCRAADHIFDEDNIKLYMNDGWLTDWYNSQHGNLNEWLMAEYKKYKLTKFEHDFLQNYVEQYVGEIWFGTSDFCMGMKKLGYFKNIPANTHILDILENCEVISDD